MGYLNPLRLHFAGTFQAAVSTVNNDATHFNNATFKPEYQLLQAGKQLNGWWNPGGDAAWRLIGCKVTAAWLSDESPFAFDDPVLHCFIADSDRQAEAKLVDLDPEQQMVSEIWGLEVRICDKSGYTLLRGQFEPAGFMDIWDRSRTGRGDSIGGAMYQSVLSNLEWGERRKIDHSPFLKALKKATHKDGLLAIKFNVDGYNMNFGTPDFTRGRIVGTIAPASADELKYVTLGRQFIATASPNGVIFAPEGGINFCTAVVDSRRGKIWLDLGNALPTTAPGGPIVDMGPLSLAYEQPPVRGQKTPQWVSLGTISYTAPGWYESTAGIVELPADRNLTAEELSAIGSSRLALLRPGPGGALAPAILEAPGGLHVKTDQFVFRLSPGDEVDVKLFATRFGQPYPDVPISLALDPGPLQVPPDLGWPEPGVPTSAIEFPSTTTPTGQDGSAIATIRVSDPGNPRGYIDGQVYAIKATLPGMQVKDYPLNPWNFISLLVWDAFTPDEPPTWLGSLQPIFQQYANLYPVMNHFLDLSSYDSICENLDLMRLAFSLDYANPNSMPVTRDLSPAKRAAIQRWLHETGPDGKPLLGTVPSQAVTEVASAPTPPSIAPSAQADTVAAPERLLGGKTAAARNRLMLRPSYRES